MLALLLQVSAARMAVDRARMQQCKAGRWGARECMTAAHTSAHLAAGRRGHRVLIGV